MKRIVLLVVLVAGCLFATAQEREFSEAYRKGVEAMGQEDIEGAKEWFRKALRENPRDGYSMLMMAGIHEAEGKLDMALGCVDAALDFFPKEDKEYRGAALTLRGRILWAMKRGEEALESLTKAITLNPGNVTFYYTRGEMLWRLGRYDESDKDFQRVVKMEPGNVVGYAGLGRNAMEREEYEKALGWFAKARCVDSLDAGVYLGEAECYLALRDYKKAGEMAVAALVLDVRNQDSMRFLADLAERDFPATKAALEKMLDREDGDFWYFCLGSICYATYRCEEAVEYFKAGYDRRRYHVYPYNIARCLMDMGRPREALPYAREAVELAVEEREDVERCISLKKRVMDEIEEKTGQIPQ